MKILWIDLNSSYAHSSLALPALHAQVRNCPTYQWDIVSATINCLINFKVVFKSNQNLLRACLKYFAVVVVQLCCSAALVFVATEWLHTTHDVLIKAVIDTILFFISFFVQRRFVF